MTTSCMLGGFPPQSSTRNEFLSLITNKAKAGRTDFNSLEAQALAAGQALMRPTPCRAHSLQRSICIFPQATSHKGLALAIGERSCSCANAFVSTLKWAHKYRLLNKGSLRKVSCNNSTPPSSINWFPPFFFGKFGCFFFQRAMPCN